MERLVIGSQNGARMRLICIVWWCAALLAAACYSQDDQASLVLDVKRARAEYELALEKLEYDKALLEKDAISRKEYSASKNALLSAEIEYQKLALRVIAQQSYIVVEKAIKYQTEAREKRVKVFLRGTMEGNQEYLDQFSDHLDVFAAGMQSKAIYNIFISLVNLSNQTIISAPYEIRIPSLKLGKMAEVDFGLLKDVESVQISLNYGGRKDLKNIYLEKSAGSDVIDISAVQFSQEANLGSEASYDLTLERFSNSGDIYRLVVLNLPPQIGYSFMEKETEARISQLRYTQGVDVKKLLLRVFMPTRQDEQVVIDKPIEFFALALPEKAYRKLMSETGKVLSEKEIAAGKTGYAKLTIVPRGIGIIDVRVNSLYHQISAGDSVKVTLTIRNSGTRRLDNIRISADGPVSWRCAISPDLIETLIPAKERVVDVTISPPGDVDVGAQEVRIKTEAVADNRSVESDDKTVRIKIVAKTPIVWIAVLILMFGSTIAGIVVFAVKISKR